MERKVGFLFGLASRTKRCDDSSLAEEYKYRERQVEKLKELASQSTKRIEETNMKLILERPDLDKFVSLIGDLALSEIRRDEKDDTSISLVNDLMATTLEIKQQIVFSSTQEATSEGGTIATSENMSPDSNNYKPPWIDSEPTDVDGWGCMNKDKEFMKQLGVNSVLSTVDVHPFFPSKAFDGKRKGYAFYMGDKGLGYYIDPHQSETNSQDMPPSDTKDSSTVDDVEANIAVLRVKQEGIGEDVQRATSGATLGNSGDFNFTANDTEFNFSATNTSFNFGDEEEKIKTETKTNMAETESKEDGSDTATQATTFKFSDSDDEQFVGEFTFSHAKECHKDSSVDVEANAVLETKKEDLGKDVQDTISRGFSEGLNFTAEYNEFSTEMEGKTTRIDFSNNIVSEGKCLEGVDKTAKQSGIMNAADGVNKQHRNVDSFLKQIRLEMYSNVIQEMGISTVDELKTRMDEIMEETKMKLGHKSKLRNKLREYKKKEPSASIFGKSLEGVFEFGKSSFGQSDMHHMSRTLPGQTAIFGTSTFGHSQYNLGQAGDGWNFGENSFGGNTDGKEFDTAEKGTFGGFASVDSVGFASAQPGGLMLDSKDQGYEFVGQMQGKVFDFDTTGYRE